MSEQDDLLGKQTEENENAPGEDETGESRAAATDNEPGDIAGAGIASGEVRVVNSPARKGRLVLLLGVLVLLLIGGGYFLLNEYSASGVSQPEAGLKKDMPKRYVIEKQVEVEVVDAQQVASVERGDADVEPAEAEVESAISATPAAEIEENSPQPASEAKAAVPSAEDKSKAEVQLLVGPYLSRTAAEQTERQLAELGYSAEMTRGRGEVTMFRLLEGIYQKADVRERLDVVRTVVKDAFALPVGDKWAIYVGSFSDQERARKYVSQLAGKGVRVTPVASEVEMDGRMLLIAAPGREAARQAEERIGNAGLSVKQARK